MTTLIMAADTFGWGTVANWLREVNAKRIQRRDFRASVKALSALSDRELWDIGICRGDIQNVINGDTTLERTRRANMDKMDGNTNLKGWV